MSDWSRQLRYPNSVRQYFRSGAPALVNLGLLRVVFAPGALKVAFAFSSIPAGATERWRRLGYTAVDLILRLSGPSIECIDSAALLAGQDDVSVDLQHDRVEIRGPGGPLLIAAVEYVDANFVPDPIMRRAEAYRDESGTDLEPSPRGDSAPDFDAL